MVVIANTVQLEDSANVRRWCQAWNVTLNQLRIAVARVGIDAGKVKADIFGMPVAQASAVQSWGECFGRTRMGADPVTPRRRNGRKSQAAWAYM